MSNEQESSWQDDLRVLSCQAWQSAKELIEGHRVDGDSPADHPNLVRIAAALIQATRLADLGHTTDPKIWAAYQAGLLATAVVKDPKGKALFDRLGEMESIDAGRERGIVKAIEKRTRWNDNVENRARDFLKALPADMSEDSKAKRIRSQLVDDNGEPFGLTAIKEHLFGS